MTAVARVLDRLLLSLALHVCGLWPFLLSAGSTQMGVFLCVAFRSASFLQFSRPSRCVQLFSSLGVPSKRTPAAGGAAPNIERTKAAGNRPSLAFSGGHRKWRAIRGRKFPSSRPHLPLRPVSGEESLSRVWHGPPRLGRQTNPQ